MTGKMSECDALKSSDRIGSGRVGSGRVGSGRVENHVTRASSPVIIFNIDIFFNFSFFFFRNTRNDYNSYGGGMGGMGGMGMPGMGAGIPGNRHKPYIDWGVIVYEIKLFIEYKSN